MTRTLKALGLALLAVSAIGAVAASSASAAEDILTCTEQESCDITATGKLNATTFGAKSSPLTVICGHEEFQGTVKNKASSATVTPIYKECQAFGSSATVDTTGCHYIITGNTTSHENTEKKPETDAAVSLQCTTTTEPHVQHVIKVTGTGCTITIGSVSGGKPVNQNLHGVTYDKEGSGSTDDVKVTVTVDSIHYTTSGALCAATGLPATGNDGTLTGTVTAKGYVDPSDHGPEDHVGLTYHEV
jgi:hypothetical protein